MAGLLELLMGQRNNNTPGINPNEPNPHTQNQGLVGKTDGFLNSDGGSLLLNLLAQQGFSTVPQSPLGALGRAGVATQQQKQARERSLLENNLLRARASGTVGGSDAPSSVREFEFFEKLSPAEKKRFLAVKRAQQLENVPGAGLGSFNPLTGGLDPVVTEDQIVSGIGSRSGAAETGKQDAITASITEQSRLRAEADRVNKASAELPGLEDKTNRVISEGKEIIEQLESGELKTGFFRGQLPAIKTNEQLFDVFSGEQVLEKISSATFGALSEGEREFLRTTVSSRTKTPEANIEIIKRKIEILQNAERRAKAAAGVSDDNVIDFNDLP